LALAWPLLLKETKNLFRRFLFENADFPNYIMQDGAKKEKIKGQKEVR